MNATFCYVYGINGYVLALWPFWYFICLCTSCISVTFCVLTLQRLTSFLPHEFKVLRFVTIIVSMDTLWPFEYFNTFLSLYACISVTFCVLQLQRLMSFPPHKPKCYILLRLWYQWIRFAPLVILILYWFLYVMYKCDVSCFIAVVADVISTL